MTETNIKNMLRIFLDSIRDYELESGNSICHDDRSSNEFVEIFINSEDAFEYHNLLKFLNAPPESQNINENEDKKNNFHCTNIACPCLKKSNICRYQPFYCADRKL